MHPPLCGRGWTLCLLVLPRAIPIPQAAEAAPEGLWCIRRCLGVAGPYAYLVLPRIGMARGRTRIHKDQPLPDNVGYTPVPPVLPRPLGG